MKDHDHLTSKFRGPAHESCNFKYQNPNFIPVLFHNLSGYYSHLFIKAMGQYEEDNKVIPNTEEKCSTTEKEKIKVAFLFKESSCYCSLLIKTLFYFHVEVAPAFKFIHNF